MKSGGTTVIVWLVVAVFPQLSLTVYVLVIMISQSSETSISSDVTVRLALVVQLSLIVSPRASSSTIVVAEGGASDREQPWVEEEGMEPIIVGGTRSLTIIVCVTSIWFRQSSVTE